MSGLRSLPFLKSVKRRSQKGSKQLSVPSVILILRKTKQMELQRAKEDLRAQVAAIAVAGAEKILENTIDQAANEELMKKLASEL